MHRTTTTKIKLCRGSAIKELAKREEENTGKNAFTSIVFLADNVEVTWSLPEERTLEQSGWGGRTFLVRRNRHYFTVK